MTLSSRFPPLAALFALSLMLPPLAAAQDPSGGAPAQAQAQAQAPAPAPAPAATAFDRLTALAGDWVDLEGTFGTKGEVAVLYRLTGNGSAVVETLFPGKPHEMVTVYHKDGNDLVLTHYCASGNQPRMRAKTVSGNVLAFNFDGGTNLDPAKDSHMHASRMEFLSTDEIRGEWTGWDKGKPSDHVVEYHLQRKTS